MKSLTHLFCASDTKNGTQMRAVRYFCCMAGLTVRAPGPKWHQSWPIKAGGSLFLRYVGFRRPVF